MLHKRIRNSFVQAPGRTKGVSHRSETPSVFVELRGIEPLASRVRF